MSGLLDDMLRLARLDQHPGQQHDPVDLTALLRGCAERTRIAEPQRTWHDDIAAGLVTTGDEELLRRAIDNLLANVRAHTPHDAIAAITAAHDGTARAAPNHPRGLRVTLTLPACNPSPSGQLAVRP